MNTFAQREQTGHYRRRRSSIPTVTSTSKTDLESVRCSPGDTAKTRKIKFIFRVREIDSKNKIKFFNFFFV